MCCAPIAVWYTPVMCAARLGAQTPLVVKVFGNRTPCSASESIFGVSATVSPNAPRRELMSSVMNTITLGRSGMPVEGGSAIATGPARSISKLAAKTGLNRLMGARKRQKPVQKKYACVLYVSTRKQFRVRRFLRAFVRLLIHASSPLPGDSCAAVFRHARDGSVGRSRVHAAQYPVYRR